MSAGSKASRGSGAHPRGEGRAGAPGSGRDQARAARPLQTERRRVGSLLMGVGDMQKA